MTPTGLLNSLREKDPELCARFADEELIEYECSCGYLRTFDASDLIDSAQEAWLQHCLQEAIRARGWLLEQSTFTASPTAKIWKKTDPAWMTYSAAGGTEAEALLRAYLAALEATE